MTPTFPFAILILVAACGQQDRPSAPNNDVAAALRPPVAKAAAPSLNGDWRVTAIAGQSVTGMAAAFADGRASVSAGCLRRAWTFRQDRNLVAFSGAPGSSSNCGRSPTAEEETAFGAIGDANLAIFGKDGREATLSGTGGTLTLERR